jgi:hypothetical protein
MGIYFKEESDNIFRTLLDNLKSLNNEKPFNNRYIGLDEINEIGPFVNWKKLLGYN